MIERRKEVRKTIPEMYQTRMKLKIRTDSGPFAPAKLLNVSLRGIKMSCPFGLALGSVIECSISMPQSFEEILVYAIIRYCFEDELGGAFGIGAEIVQTSERLWVRAFFKIHDFIDENLRIQAQGTPASAQFLRPWVRDN